MKSIVLYKKLSRIITSFAVIAFTFSTSISQAQSILSSGQWVQISVSESGVYKITYDDLIKWGFSDVSQIAVFGNGAEELSLINTSAIPDTLHEIGIYMEKGSDNIFNSGDYILFFGKSPHIWSYDETDKTFTHKTHSYSDKNYYFISTNFKATKFISTSNIPISSASKVISGYDELQAYEQNNINTITTGRNFFESISNNKTISFSIPNITTNTATITISAAARHTSASTIGVNINGTSVGNIAYSAATSNKPYAYLKAKSFNFIPNSETINIGITLNYSGSSSRGFLDYCLIHARCSLQANGTNQLMFRDTNSITANTVGEFRISSSSQMSVWNISNPELPVNITTSFSNNITTFIADVSQLKEYVAYSSTFKSVTFEKNIDNQNILSATNADMIIIANDIYKDYAQKIADLHQQIDNLTTKIISQEEICNEFSSGRKDVASIRNYLRYLYIQGNKNLKYVLLFGDGTYDNKSIELNGNKIFTFQTHESLNEDYSLCSDDFFVLLDNNEGVNNNDYFTGETDVAIGRIPVNTTDEAQIITNKIVNYATNKEFKGDWQNYLCFLADDADDDQPTHMIDADLICSSINNNYPIFNIKKIYADAYQQSSNSSGERYPDVNTEISNQIQKGCLVFNYSGHGNETRMMAEYAIDASTIESWENKTKLPLFIGAACNIAHFDYSGTSIGEQLLTQKNGGGIGIISATRYSYASSNYTLCKNIYTYLFSTDSDSKPITIGEAFKLAKSITPNDIYQNKRVYTLLGDPALRLAVPYYKIVLDSINSQKTSEFTDTIHALSSLRISGHIENANSLFDSTYNGTLYIKLFDKKQSITTLGNEGNDPFTFQSYTNILFQGLASIKNGKFYSTAIIPLDIYYYDGMGRLSLYATNDSIQASGEYSQLIINGNDSFTSDDATGPDISLFLNDKTFISGGMTNQNPTIYIYVTDSSGINISNASIGHDILIEIDNSEQIILNDFYYADLNTYLSGSIEYQLQNLEEGEHTLTITIWDALNNVTEDTLYFYVVNSENITLKNLFNYPNPMKNITHFHFEHNQADYNMKVTLKIYDISGNLIRMIEKEDMPSGFNDESISWDGTSANGSEVQQGIYPYTIEIQTESGEKIYGEQKILLIK